MVYVDGQPIPLPDSIPDPLERFNRGVWQFNKGVLTYVVKPSAKVYRFFVCRPLRTGISNAGDNILYPRRIINNLLQERWTGARDESYRFLCNSVLGIGGLFDVATKLEIARSEADFGQTFASWGWSPHFYLMLPISGPSNDRDAVGAAADSAVNPLSYFPPYSYINYGITYNNLAEKVDAYVRQARSEKDPYYVLRYVHSFVRDFSPVDFSVEGEQHIPSLETLRSVFFNFKDPKFPERGATRRVLIPSTGRELPYSFWEQPKRAPVVYVLPGIGSHRLNGSALALAELLYHRGFSVVSLSSAFNGEFIESASTAAVPGYSPVDARDIQVAINQIDAQLQKGSPGRISGRALAGFSMGGYHTLFIAANSANSSDVQFDRYLAINTPVRLLHAVSQLDSFFAAPLEMAEEVRKEKVHNTFKKVAALQAALDSGTPPAAIPFNSIESRFLIGTVFRLVLRDAIFTSQMQTNMQVLKEPLDPWKREAVYREIMQYSFTDYLEKFVIPYYRERGVDLDHDATLGVATDLRHHEEALKRSGKIRIVENANDILVSNEDVEWLIETFGRDRIVVFNNGGHLGNLSETIVQKVISDALEDLLPPITHAAQ